MEQGLMLALLLVTANLDTLLLAAVWHSDGRRITWQEAGILILTTSLMTGLALLLGQCGSGLWSATAAKRISALLLVGMGLWMLLDWLRQLGETAAETAPKKGRGGMVSTLLLGLALGANNSGLGLAAGLAGISPVWAVLGNAVVTLAALALGGCLAGRWLGKVLGDWQVPISGALLIVMGALAGI